MPFKSEAQRRWMYATHPKMAKKWEKHTPKGKKLPEKVKGGVDESSRTCPHCKTKLTKYLGGSGYAHNPDHSESYAGCYACDNEECPCVEKNGCKYSVPIMNVSEDTMVVLNGENYLLEIGDRITIEHC